MVDEPAVGQGGAQRKPHAFAMRRGQGTADVNAQRPLGEYDAVVRRKKAELVVTAFVGLLLLIVSSSLMYAVESKVQPEKLIGELG